MTTLIPLSQIPYSARQTEASERTKYPTRAMALDAATIKIVDAPGTYGGPWPKTRGWVLTATAARAISEVRCRMPGGTSHRLWDCQDGFESIAALGQYLEQIARDPSDAGRSAALAAYRAAEQS